MIRLLKMQYYNSHDSRLYCTAGLQHHWILTIRSTNAVTGYKSGSDKPTRLRPSCHRWFSSHYEIKQHYFSVFLNHIVGVEVISVNGVENGVCREYYTESVLWLG